MKKSETRLKFDTQKNIRNERFKHFVLGFCVFLLVFGGVSVLLMLRYYDYDLSKIKKQPETTDLSALEETTEYIPETSGKRSYLFFCRSDDGKEIRFAAVVGADLDKKTLSVLPVDCEKSVSVGGCSGNLSAQLVYGGALQLKAATEALCGIKIDKYLGSADAGFRKAINYFGGLVVDVPSKIDVRNDKLTAIIQAGEQTMTGDMLLKYIRVNENRPGVQADIVSKILSQFMISQNLPNADKFFDKVINLVDSDISVLDFASMKPGIKALILTGEGRSVEVVSQLFVGGDGE